MRVLVVEDVRSLADDIAEGLKTGDEIVVDGGLFVQFMQTQ